jgi:UrcA family protein
MILLPLILISTAAVPQPTFAVVHGDLALAQAADRAELRARVSTAVRNFCAKHADEVVPQVFRNDNFHCLERARNAVVADMPRDVRAAYRLALKEAGIVGRRL